MSEPGPAWVPCPLCQEWWCAIHQQHAADCPCPPIEEWPVDPYQEHPPEPLDEDS